MTTADEIINLSAKKNDLRRMHLIHHKPMPSSVTTVLAPVIYTHKTNFIFLLFFGSSFFFSIARRKIWEFGKCSAHGCKNLSNHEIASRYSFRDVKNILWPVIKRRLFLTKSGFGYQCLEQQNSASFKENRKLDD